MNTMKPRPRVTTGTLRKVTDGRGHWGRLLIDGKRPAPFSIGLFGHAGPRLVWMR